MEDDMSNIVNTLKNMLQQDNGSNSSGQDNSSNTNNENSFFDNNSIDFQTLLKMKSVFETLNQNDDPRSNLLHSLKPYLRETRQKKIDQYVNLLKITKVTNLFKSEKGDEK